MAFNKAEVSAVASRLERALVLDSKATLVESRGFIDVDDNDDFKITNAQQVAAFVASRRAQRDALIANIQPTVAAWTP